MRIWSLHPEFLDNKGLVAVWRETLLAKVVLEGKTTGYNHHPQLNRFRASEYPLDAINYYLSEVYKEAVKRGYRFDKTKFNVPQKTPTMPVTRGQVQYETVHLLEKLKKRDPERFNALALYSLPGVHPVFYVVEGEVEEWEKRF